MLVIAEWRYPLSNGVPQTDAEMTWVAWQGSERRRHENQGAMMEEGLSCHAKVLHY